MFSAPISAVHIFLLLELLFYQLNKMAASLLFCRENDRFGFDKANL